MRKGTLLFALAFAVAASTAAMAAKKPGKSADPAVAAQKDSSALFDDAFHPWAPSTTMKVKAKGKKKK